MNPMSGRNGMGFDPVMAAMVTQKINNLAGRRQNAPDPFEALDPRIPGTDDFARRRAASFTQLFQSNATLREAHANDGTQVTNMTGTVGTVAGGQGNVGGMIAEAGGPAALRSNETGEALPAMDVDRTPPVPKPRTSKKKTAPIPPPRKIEKMEIDKKTRKNQKKSPPAPPTPVAPPRQRKKAREFMDVDGPRGAPKREAEGTRKIRKYRKIVKGT